MRRILLALSTLALLATTASAGGINLSWDDCGTFGLLAKNFGCDTNLGSDALICSAVAPLPMPQFVAMAATIDLVANQATLPSWWTLETGCRTTPSPALSLDLNFVAGPFNCRDVWQGQAFGGLNYVSGFTQPNRARFRMVCAVPSSASIALDNVTENYLFRVLISHTNTIGSGSCPGCDVGVCLVLTRVELDQPVGLGDNILTNPLLHQYAIWQGGASVQGGCPAATPVRTSTWGALKSLYR